MRIVNKLVSYKEKDSVLSLTTNACEIRILFLTDEIIRIRAGFEDNFKESSYSLMMTAWPDSLDEVVGKDRKKVSSKSFSLEEDETYLTVIAKKMKVRISKEIFKISIFDDENHEIHTDIADLAFYEDSNKRRIHTSEIAEGDCYFGFGEKTGVLNKRNKMMTMSPRDTMGYNPIESDSLYKHIPFYIKANKMTKKACGYFYHSSAECEFNMGKEHSNYWKKHSTFRTNDGDIDLFFILGPQISDIIERYTDLTGKSLRLPSYALGYLGSSMYYSELEKDCDREILDFVDIALQEKIPIDGFQLSSGYTTLENKRYVFEWNEDRFPNPKNFFAEMNERGITTSPNVKPGLLLTHPRLDELKKKDIFVKDSKNEEFAIGSWWGGKGLFVDFTKPSAREIWKILLKEHLFKYGVDSVWNDNCEYESVIDMDAKVDFEGQGEKLGNLRVLMANLMCKTTIEAMKDVYPNKRPFVVCRAGYAGIQQYAQSWSGDNFTSWDSLKYNISTILGMALSGVTNYGADIGGFYGNAPEEELFVRWVQNGIFQPRFSIHSTNSDNTVTEPWMFKDSTKYIREAILLRYRMFPMYYSLMVNASITGLPIIRPLVMVFQEDEKCYDNSFDFVVGNSILVSNVIEKGEKQKSVYLPKGHNYYDFVTRKQYVGGQTISIDVEMDSIPMFIIGGSISVFANHQLYNLHKEHVNSLNIIIAPDSDCSFTHYEDDGVSEDYKDGKQLKQVINIKSGDIVEVSFSNEGDFDTRIEHILLDVIHTDSSPYWVKIDDHTIPHAKTRSQFESDECCWYYSQTKRSVLVKYKNIKQDYHVDISFENFDMIGM